MRRRQHRECFRTRVSRDGWVRWRLLVRRLVQISGIIVALITAIPLAAAHAEPNEVRLFIGVTHGLLDNTEAQVRGFAMLQELLLNVKRKLPLAIRRNSRVGDVTSWKWPEDRKKIEQLNFTHYLIAEPKTTGEAGAPALEIKWYVGTFSPDDDRALDGWLKERDGAPRRVISIPNPKLDSSRNNQGYEEAEFRENRIGADGKAVWEKVKDPASLAEELVKILKHIFPEMRSQNLYFIQCIEDVLLRNDLKGINTGLMTLLSGNLKTDNWLPALQLGRDQAEYICTDRDYRYRTNPVYNFADADFLITGLLAWDTGAKAQSKFRVDNRVAEMRRAYVTLAAEASASSEELNQFCAEPEAFLRMPVLIKLVEYIHGYGFKLGNAVPPQGDWKCN